MAKKKPVLEIVNSSGLTEADWIGINKVRGAYERGGWDAFWSELETLDDDVMLQITIIGAFFPDVIRTAIKEELAAARGVGDVRGNEDLIPGARRNLSLRSSRAINESCRLVGMARGGRGPSSREPSRCQSTKK